MLIPYTCFDKNTGEIIRKGLCEDYFIEQENVLEGELWVIGDYDNNKYKYDFEKKKVVEITEEERIKIEKEKTQTKLLDKFYTIKRRKMEEILNNLTINELKKEGILNENEEINFEKVEMYNINE